MADLTTLLSKFLGSLALFSGSASGVLTTSTTTAGTIADTNETDLWTYSLPANSLSVDGKAVRITVSCSTGATVNNKTTKLYFGSTVVTSRTAGPDNDLRYTISAVVLRTSSAAQFANGTFGIGANTTFSNTFVSNTQTTPAETMANAITIKVTGQNGTGAVNDIVFKSAVVELLN